MIINVTMSEDKCTKIRIRLNILYLQNMDSLDEVHFKIFVNIL